MKEQKLTVTENRALTESVYRMELAGEALEAQKPGQFVNIRLDGLFLRRPISVYDSAEGCLTIIYKAVGKGTRQMTGLKPGAELDVLTGLGNGYDLAKAGNRPLLLAKILRYERPDAIVPGIGGQTGLNLAMQLERKGVLKECGTELLGTSSRSMPT